MAKNVMVLALLLAGCFDKQEAIARLRNMGRPLPIECVQVGDTPNGMNATFTCTDGGGNVWHCDSEDCIRTGKR